MMEFCEHDNNPHGNFTLDNILTVNMITIGSSRILYRGIIISLLP
jgi:hypothetical protein